jgi:hypothetical membrane protein
MRRHLAETAIAGAVVYIAIDVVLALVDPQYSLIHDAESDYGAGPNAWLMDANFILRGIFSFAAILAIALTTNTQGRSRWGLALIAAWAFCSLLLAFFPDNPMGSRVTTSGRIHLLLAGIAFAAICAGTLLTSLRLAAELPWAAVRPYLFAISALAIVPAVLAVLTIRRPLGDFGLFERVFLGLEILWLAVASGSAWAIARSHARAEASP